MAIATKRNKYGLDPFRICFPAFQTYYGKGETDSAWPLIMRTMFHILYSDKVRAAKKQEGKYLNSTALPSEIEITPKEWARIFNAMCTTLREASPPRIERPIAADDTNPEAIPTQIFNLLGEGKDKVRAYRSDPAEKVKTRLILTRMEKHMKSVVRSLPENYKDELP